MLKCLTILLLVMSLANKPLPVHGNGDHQQSDSKQDTTDPASPPHVATEVEKENASNAERYAYYKTHKKEYIKKLPSPLQTCRIGFSLPWG
jgi:hypothetical protein